MGATEAAVLFELKLLRGIFFVLGCRIVPLLAFSAGKSDDVSHWLNPS
jgi:hypothetical protein